MSKGFTLVELSIVLVIVGLLIGGILVAQSMIHTAKVNGVVKQISEFDVAIANYHTKYNQKPGDSNLFIACGIAVWVCNNDGVTDGSGYETGFAWRHLSLGVDLRNSKGQLYTQFQSFGPPHGPGPLTETYVPKLNLDVIDKDNTYFVVAHYALGVSRYVSRYGYPSVGVGTYPYRTNDLVSLDKKLDDGVASTGGVTATGSGTTCRLGSGRYNLDNTGYVCDLYVEVGLGGSKAF